MSSFVPFLINENDDQLALQQLRNNTKTCYDPSSSSSSSSSPSNLLPSSSSSTSLEIQPSLKINFNQLSTRFKNDVSSTTICKSHESFWNTLIESLTRTYGFHTCTFGTNHSTVTSATATAASAPTPQDHHTLIDFASKYGKLHLDAVTALLGISMDQAKTLTLQVLLQQQQKQQQVQDDNRHAHNHKDEKKDKDEHEIINKPTITTNTTAAVKISSLVGTQTLLILVRDHHYQQQISRIQFITESLRYEQANDDDDDDDGNNNENDDDDDDDNNEHEEKRKSCQSFLNELDQCASLRLNYNAADGVTTSRVLDRGLFKFLICIACAPIETLQREQLYKSVELLQSSQSQQHEPSDDQTNGIFSHLSSSSLSSSLMPSSTITTSTSRQEFAKNIMHIHEQHYNSTLRTEALEALFMLLYTRIQGGITRSDYILLLLAFDQQSFFCPSNSSSSISSLGTKYVSLTKKSQLCSLILAECMSLWHATNNTGMNSDNGDHNKWVQTHPFFTDNSGAPVGAKTNRVMEELHVISNLLIETFGQQVLIRRQEHLPSSNMITDGGGTRSDTIVVEAPESIAIMTFGLLLNLTTNAATSATATIDPFWTTHGASLMDISVQCISMANNDCGAFEYLTNVMTTLLPEFDFMSVIMKKSHLSFEEEEWSEYKFYDDCHRTASSSVHEEDPTLYTRIDVVEDATCINYASIGREILVGTISAIRHMITASNIDNVLMLSKLASSIYRNNSILCAQFWSDWNSSTNHKEDPMCHLLDVVYQIANNAMKSDDSIYDMSGMNRSKFAASILSTLQPCLQFITSLIPSDGSHLHDIMQAFLSDGIIQASILGCYYICSGEEFTFQSGQSTVDYDASLESASIIMTCLSRIAGLIQENDSNSVEFLRLVLTPEINNVHLLSEIAYTAHQKVWRNIESRQNSQNDLEIQRYSRMSSCALYTMVSLLEFETVDDNSWTNRLLDCLSKKSERVDFFANSMREEVTKASIQCLYRLTCNAAKVMMSKNAKDSVVMKYLKVLENGMHSVFDILVSYGLNINRNEQIISYSIWIVQMLLKTFHDICQSHSKNDILNYARDIRNCIINKLASSTEVGKMIGYLSMAAVQAFKQTMINGFQGEKRLECCGASLSLLLSWSHVSEHVAADYINLKLENTLSDTSTNTLSTGQEKILSECLEQFGPGRLLESLPESSNNADDSPYQHQRQKCDTVLTQLSQLVCMPIDMNDHRSENLAAKAIKLLTKCIVHANTIKKQNPRAMETLYSPKSVERIGSNLNQALDRYWTYYDNKERTSTFKLLLHLIELLRLSASTHPMLTSRVIFKQKKSNLLIDKLVDAIPITQQGIFKDTLISAGSTEVVNLLLKNHIHRRDSIGSLNSKGELPAILSRKEKSIEYAITTLSSCVDYFDENSKNQAINAESLAISAADSHQQSLDYYKDLKMLQLFTSSLQIITSEISVHLYNSNNILPEKITVFLTNYAQKGFIMKSFESLTIFGMSSQSRASVALNDAFLSSNVGLSIKSVQNMSSAIDSVEMIDECSNKVLFKNSLILLHMLGELAKSQFQYVRTLTTFGELILMTHPNSLVFETVAFMNDIEQSVILLSEITNSISLSYSSQIRSIYDYYCTQIFDVSQSIVNYLVTAISSIARETIVTDCIVGILEQLMKPLQFVFSLEKTNRPNFELRSKVLSLLCCIVEAIKKQKELLGDNAHSFRKSRISCMRLVCDTLSSLKDYSKGKNIYNDGNLILCQKAFSCLSLLMTNEDGEHQQNMDFALQTFRFEQINVLKDEQAIELILFHLQSISNIYIETCNSAQNQNFTPHQDYCLVTIINAFDLIVTLSGNVEISQLMFDNYVVNVLAQNPLVRYACNQLSTSKCRGYLQHKQPSWSTTQMDTNKCDPLHYVWRCVIRTCASLMRSINVSAPNRMLTSTNNKVNTTSIIDFLRSFEGSIDGLISFFERLPPQDFVSSMGNNTLSYFGYNKAILNETSDILSLLSELYSSQSLNGFETTAPELFHKYIGFSMKVVISLSSFLGAISTSRDLFALLDMCSKMDDETMMTMHHKLASHPLLVDGISSGNFEANQHAFLANKYCTCVAKEDFQLAQTKSIILKEHLSGEENQQSFEIYVENDFLFQMESMAGHCLYSALKILMSVHPCSSSFVSFNESESNNLRLASIPTKGTVVKLRRKDQNSNNMLLSKLTNHLDYARILEFNEVDNSIDVQYIGKSVMERNVHISRLAGIEDMSKKISVFEYKSAAETIKDLTSRRTSNVTVGHLIKILRWCRQNISRMDQIQSEHFTPQNSIKSIAEVASILLINEVSLEHQFPSPDEHEKAMIRRQLFDLFGDEELFQHFDLSDSSRKKKDNNATHSFKNKVDPLTWTMATQAMQYELITARKEQEHFLEHSEQNGNFGWSASSSTLHQSRRSPFK